MQANEKSFLTSAEAQARGLPSLDEQIERYNQAVRTERAIVLSDGRTTLADASRVASEMHELAEECANAGYDTITARLSEGAAIIEMLVAKVEAAL